MFQLILVENKKKIKTLYKSPNFDSIDIKFNEFKSEKVDFPKKFIYKTDKKVLIPTVYEILLIKPKNYSVDEKKVNKRMVFVGDITSDDNEWDIVDRSVVFFEEIFMVTGANRKLNTKEIIDNIIVTRKNNHEVKQVLIMQNKLIVEGLSLHMIICKNEFDAKRLYSYLRTYCYEHKIKWVGFFGSLSRSSRKEWYKKIHKLTGVGYDRLYRKLSR
jgi:hypothetical protein